MRPEIEGSRRARTWVPTPASTSCRRLALLGSAAVAAWAAAATGASAQTTPSATPAPQDPNAVSELVVTGSRIRGVAPVGSTVISVGQDELEKAPAANVVELLRRVPQVGGAGITEAYGGVLGPGVTSSNATRTGALNLRGLGPKATLVLFNGQRMPTAGLNGAQIDPAAIPTSVLQRIEIVADGASAIYGSDAVAGVVNFVPITRFDGVETRARLSYADGYELRQVSALAGKDWGSGSALVALEHNYNTNLNGTERDFYRSDLTPFGGRDYRSAQCNPGNILVGGVSYAIPPGGVTPATASSLTPNTRNFCELYRLGDILAQQQRESAYFSVTQEVTPGIEVYLRGVWSYRFFRANDTQQGSSTSVANLTVPRSNAFFVAPPGTNPSSLTVQYYFGDDAGQLRFKGHSRYYQLIGGTDFRLPADWRGNLTGSWGRTDDDVFALIAHPASLNAALRSSDPATAFNPFGRPNSPAVNSQIFRGLFNSRPRSMVASGQLEANGPLIELPGGPARLALGLDFTELRFTGSSNRGTIDRPTHTFSSNSREIWAAYAELFLPIVGPGNELPGVRRLDVSLAGRIDDYSDVGTTTNPKVGVNWSPLEGLLLKASYGTSFKAPYLSDTLSPKAGASLTVNTTPDPLSPTGASTGIQINDGRPGLSPEEATTYSFTAEWEPVFLPGFRASLTYFDVDYTGQIFAPVITNVLINPIWAGSVIRNPSPEQVQQLIEETGLPIRGVLPPRVDFIFDGRPQNLGGTEVSGFDFMVAYNRPTNLGDVFASVTGSYLTKYDLKVTPLAPAQDQLNKIYYPLQFRMRGELGLQRGPWTGQVMANYANRYDNNLVTPEQDVDSFTTFDARVSYSFEGGSYWTRDLEASLEISNIFDEEPPFVDVQGGYDPSAASAIGRMFTVTLAKRW